MTNGYYAWTASNDLESIAGEIASGCNLIYFVTGNGSVTNFPLRAHDQDRHHHPLPAHDMLASTGAYLDSADGRTGADMLS